MYVIQHLPGHSGPATVVLVHPDLPAPVVYVYDSYADMIASLASDHEAARLLDQPIIDLLPAPTDDPQD